MSSHRFDCLDCENFDEKRKCCHQSTIPVMSKSMSAAVEFAQKHEFDRKNFNRKRFVMPAYISENKK